MFFRICNHDYVTVESMTAERAAVEWVFENKDVTSAHNIVTASQYGPNNVLTDKVCMKCKQCDPQLTDFREWMDSLSTERIEQIEEDARRIFLESAKLAAKTRERTFSAREIFKEYMEARNNG